MTDAPKPSIAYYAGSDTWFQKIEVAYRDEYLVVCNFGYGHHPDRVFETKEDAKNFVRKNIISRIEKAKMEISTLESRLVELEML